MKSADLANGGMRLEVLDSLEALRASEGMLDELWRAADVALPVCRAEFIRSWCQRYAPDSRVRCLVVRSGERAVAALPLVGEVHRGLPELGTLTNNSWSETGALLVADRVDLAEVAGLLAQGIREHVSWPLIMLRYVEFERPEWRALIDALTRTGITVETRRTQEICTADLDGDFERYERGFSRNHRRSLRRRRRLLERDGGARLEMIEDVDPSDVPGLIRSGFGIEHRCWKGREGTSVFATSGMLGYYLDEAAMLARRGELALAFLVHREKRIAFQYAYRSRGHYYLPKVGYDEAYAQYSPGNILTYELMRHLSLERAPVRVDFHGESGPASLPWKTESHPVGTIAIGNRLVLGRAIVSSYSTARRLRHTVPARFLHHPHRPGSPSASQPS